MTLSHRFIHVVDHPLVQHKLTIMRNKDTTPMIFRQLLEEIAGLITYEATRQMKTVLVQTTTPLETAPCPQVEEFPIITSIMRAGNGMVPGISRVMPFAPIGYIGIYRDKFIHRTVEYYFKLPQNCKGRSIFLADPMLATGDTMVAAIDRLKDYEVGPITAITLLCSTTGLEKVQKVHPDVTIYTAHIEERMNEKGYLLPGLGDAGDRLFGTI